MTLKLTLSVTIKDSELPLQFAIDSIEDMLDKLRTDIDPELEEQEHLDSTIQVKSETGFTVAANIKIRS